MTAKKLRRRTLYLGWRKHGRIVARFGLLWGIYHIAFWEALCVREYVQYVGSLSDVEHQISFAAFFEAFARQNGWMVIFAAAFTPLFAWDLMRVTHRIVGPLKRIANALYGMVDGKTIRQITFREGDLIEDFEKAFNAYLSSLHAPNAMVGGTAAEQEVAESPIPATAAGAPYEPPVPLGDEQIAALLHELRTTKASEVLLQVGTSAD